LKNRLNLVPQLGAMLPVSTANADCCAVGAIAEMTILSAGTRAHDVQKIMNSGYNCDAQLILGAPMHFKTAIFKGQTQRCARTVGSCQGRRPTARIALIRPINLGIWGVDAKIGKITRALCAFSGKTVLTVQTHPSGPRRFDGNALMTFRHAKGSITGVLPQNGCLIGWHGPEAKRKT
jgi:hypothetical protein